VLRRYARAACNDCHTQPRSVALCLLCGTVLCPGADCCSVNGVGEAHRHARTCGAGLGLMLLVATCDLTLLFHDQLGRVNALYLDEFGDVDHNLLSGRPLSLVTERLASLHGIGGESHDASHIDCAVATGHHDVLTHWQ
jgi:hypothetical protein